MHVQAILDKTGPVLPKAKPQGGPAAALIVQIFPPPNNKASIDQIRNVHGGSHARIFTVAWGWQIEPAQLLMRMMAGRTECRTVLAVGR
jgi:hypothetical protein